MVDAVIDVRGIAREIFAALPPLLAGAGRDAVSAIGARDAGLLVVLDAARVVTDDAWRVIERSAPRSDER